MKRVLVSFFVCIAMSASFSAHADWCWDGWADARDVPGRPGIVSVTCADAIAICMQHFGPSTTPTYGDEVILTDGRIVYLMSAKVEGTLENGHFTGGGAIVTEADPEIGY